MKKVIVFGSLNMDLTIQCDAMPQSGETVEGYGFFTNPGGKGGNQAVAAAKLGAPTHMIARVGNDLFGEQLLRSLGEYGVCCENVRRSADRSTGVAVITRSGGDNRIILSSGANYEMNAGDVEAALNGLAEPGDIFMTQFECDPLTVLYSLSKAKQRGLTTMFNPAPAKKIPEEVYPSIDLIVVNQTECEFLTGIYPTGHESCASALNRFQEMGAGSALITLGERGSVWGKNGELVFAESFHVPNVDTTAAGDTYIGALASFLVQGKSMEDSMRFASRAAALTVTKHGAQQSIPYLREVEEYFRD